MNFALLCDPDRQVIEAYGVWGPKKYMGREYDGVHRATFVIDGDGTVTHAFPAVKVAGHAEEVLAVV